LASQQQNAFYKPPPSTNKTNGVKRAFEEDINRNSDRPDVTSHTVDADADMETERADSSFEKPRRSARKSGMTEEVDEEEDPLQYSVFSSKKDRSAPHPSTSTFTKKGGLKNPPGSFMESEDDEAAMDEDHEEEDTSKRKRASRTTMRATRPTHLQPQLQPQPTTTTATSSKPPAKKARQIKEKDLSRSIPGSLMDEDEEEEEEDRITPLRAPSPVAAAPTSKRPVRKARSSASVEVGDDFESGVQTRRRSSRLGATSSHHSGGSPEPVAAPASKPRKSTRTATGGARKKR